LQGIWGLLKLFSKIMRKKVKKICIMKINVVCLHHETGAKQTGLKSKQNV
jgi:hypothetical protein